jgi:hypothetical protein
MFYIKDKIFEQYPPAKYKFIDAPLYYHGLIIGFFLLTPAKR